MDNLKKTKTEMAIRARDIEQNKQTVRRIICPVCGKVGLRLVGHMRVKHRKDFNETTYCEIK